MTLTQSSNRAAEPTDPAQIERWVRIALRDLPLQRAPHSLQARVFAAVAYRQRAWWQRSFATWPTPARLVFVVFCAALAAPSVNGSEWLLNTALGRWQFDSVTLAPWHTLVVVHSSLMSSIPAPWWYGMWTLTIVACAGVFGICAIAYRTLYPAYR